MKLGTLRYADGAWSEPFPDLDSEKTVVVAFAAAEYGERPELFAELARAYPRAAVIGCSTSGEIDHARIGDGSIGVAVLRFEHTRVRYARAELRGAEKSFAAGGAIADQLGGPGLRSVLVLSRGHEVDGGELVRGIRAKLSPEVVVTGGFAGDGDRFGTTYVIGEGVPLRDAVVAIGLYGDRVRVGHGSTGGAEVGVERPSVDRLIAGARDAGHAATRAYPLPSLSIAISCAGRRLVLGERAEEETDAALAALPRGVAQVGFYSHGEISPHGAGGCDRRGQAMTLTVISEA